MKINEIFEGIQGEGTYSGHPALFVRMTGCNLACSFCDTEYKTGKEYSINDLTQIITDSLKEIIVWTGGEPTLQIDEIIEMIKMTPNKSHHLESNGYCLDDRLNVFDYLCFSPKNIEDAERIKDFGKGEIKVVTDLELNRELIDYATMLMPLSTFTRRDAEIEKNVWRYCIDNNVKYSPRLQVNLWGNEKGK
jgi:7-carboxy-7-deazaguanine synthase